mmetsp:Transcript_26792/g.57085  ORF Transcript_26792/g.57085 Transcript_26792/m.57085 type:complete len:215 (+) Transcript_26792:294-938(+)
MEVLSGRKSSRKGHGDQSHYRLHRGKLHRAAGSWGPSRPRPSPSRPHSARVPFASSRSPSRGHRDGRQRPHERLRRSTQGNQKPHPPIPRIPLARQRNLHSGRDVQSRPLVRESGSSEEVYGQMGLRRRLEEGTSSGGGGNDVERGGCGRRAQMQSGEGLRLEDRVGTLPEDHSSSYHWLLLYGGRQRRGVQDGDADDGDDDVDRGRGGREKIL